MREEGRDRYRERERERKVFWLHVADVEMEGIEAIWVRWDDFFLGLEVVRC